MTTRDEATYVESVTDARNAVAHLRTHAEDHGIGPRLVGLWGESAGGHLSAMTGVTNDVDRFSATGSAGRVDAVVDCFGVSYLPKIGADFDDEFQVCQAPSLPARLTRQLPLGAGPPAADRARRSNGPPRRRCRIDLWHPSGEI
jgi:hypothetical protein